jgi:hypothetical protein
MLREHLGRKRADIASAIAIVRGALRNTRIKLLGAGSQGWHSHRRHL